jgi:hypothetical protein
MKRYLVFINLSGFIVCSTSDDLIETTLEIGRATEFEEYSKAERWLIQHPTTFAGAILTIVK